ncbi:hypothetical protein RI129_012500 [Pyrocoelia pectoralis]|uniref:Ecdysteroid UDP-glucosyltransferase n=1 Tax=Pyrocoelia pectoralis TaxID=417401 RepID=A0AAN7UTH2_9COLE
MSTCALLHILLLIISSANAARILGISPIPMYSHQLVFRTLWRELSLKGHQVTALTSHPLRDTALTNLTEIDMIQSFKNLPIKFLQLNLPKNTLYNPVNEYIATSRNV